MEVNMSKIPASSFHGMKESDFDLVEVGPETLSVYDNASAKFVHRLRTIVGPEVPTGYSADAMRRVRQRLKEIAVELSRVHYDKHPGECYDKHFDVAVTVKLKKTKNSY
jgi:hypothetical protein